MKAKPFSPACERNQGPILSVLEGIIPDERLRLIEIGSGTGQHAVFFASRFPKLEWVTSDVLENHAGIRMWLDDAGLANVTGPLEIEIGRSEIPAGEFDLAFSANVLHIVSMEKVRELARMFGRSLRSRSQVLFYGPFNYGGRFTSASNEEFDGWLKSRDPASGIRDFEDVCRLMAEAGFELRRDHEMPSNNRLLHFERG